MARVNIYTIVISLIVLLASCQARREPELTPWGSVVGGEDTTKVVDDGNDRQYSLDEIQYNGEIIVLTVSGPDTYYDYHGHGLGVQYMLSERFAESIGVTTRVEMCRDTTEMIRKLKKGEGDVIAVPLHRGTKGTDSLRFCGAEDNKTKGQWAVLATNTTLADTLDHWYRPEMQQQTQAREDWLLTVGSIRRHVYSPYIDRGRGIYSNYDGYFQRYASQYGLDWRLLAAQCYQESCYDPQAQSWAGACGLMQLMPATAQRMGLPRSQIFDPELNIAAGARYMGILMREFADIPAMDDRINFALASYNGGTGHIRDAQALARKYGGNARSWASVQQYVLMLGSATYYQDPVVRYGYMRGTETVNYVRSIRNRY
jgi:membrane-bound lytic murein transglycosylase F